MRWIFTSCLLLATATSVVSTNRPKRDLWSIKNFISSKIFGTETIVIQLPKIPKNETFRLFKIKGYDNILLKVLKKPEKVKPKPEKPKDPIIVSPEIAIIGSYLGTTTEGETLLALEIAKDLLKSGIISGERTVQIREPVKQVNVMTKDRDPIYILPTVDSGKTIEAVNPEPVVYPSRYPPFVVASEIKYRPFQTKYSYKQESEDADLKFESYNNENVIVTRTNKIPDKPQFITLRLADIASIAAHPQLIMTNQPVQVITQDNALQPFSVEPKPIQSYVLEKNPLREPNTEVTGQQNNISTNNLNDDVPSFITKSKQPFDIRDHLSDIEVEKLNKFINAKLNSGNNNENIAPQQVQNTENSFDGNIDKLQLEANALYGNLVHRYVYKQIGDDDQEPTVVTIEDPKLNQTINIVKSSDVVPKDFVYVPPMDVDVPPLPNRIFNGYSQENNHNKYEVFVDSDDLPNIVPINLNNETDNYSSISGPVTSNNLVDRVDSNLSSTSAPYRSNFVSKLVTSTIVRANNATDNIKKFTPITPKDDLKIIGLSTTDKRNQNLKQSSYREGILKTNVQNSHSLRKNPIVVADLEHKQSKIRTYQPGYRTTSARPYTGGPVF